MLDRESRRERDRARIDATGRILNPDEAIGELACRSDAAVFEGYFKNEEADNARLSDGWYWTGDLAYRDEAGFVYFAGRNDDWLRVDSENFAAAPVERILERHTDIVAAAVYPVPDAKSADQVMAAVELRSGSSTEDFCAGLAGFLSDQADLGTKWAPRFVRIVAALPLTATGKITKTAIKRERWSCADPVIWRPERAQCGLPVPRTGRRRRFGSRIRDARTFGAAAPPMSLSPGGVHVVTTEDIETIASSLSRAFEDDPVWEYLLPDAAQPAQAARQILRDGDAPAARAALLVVHGPCTRRRSPVGPARSLAHDPVPVPPRHSRVHQILRQRDVRCRPNVVHDREAASRRTPSLLPRDPRDRPRPSGQGHRLFIA